MENKNLEKPDRVTNHFNLCEETADTILNILFQENEGFRNVYSEMHPVYRSHLVARIEAELFGMAQTIPGSPPKETEAG